jgi:hypothetical protein
MSDTASREVVLKHGDELWDELRTALDAHLLEPLSVATDWSGRDVYAHFARWQTLTIAGLRDVIAGQPPPEPEEDENVLNDRWRVEDRALDADVVRERCLSSRTELRTLLMGLSDKQWRRFGHLFAADISGEHYEHHLSAVRSGRTP